MAMSSGFSGMGGQRKSIPLVTVREAAARLAQSGAAVTLIDVREPDEYVEVRAQGAVNIPLSQLARRSGEVPHDKDVLLICHSGYRSMQAALYLKRQGIERVSNVDGGTAEWENAGLPIVRGEVRP
ncbi:MAG: rhodanese-like domain-containing protein [Ktedonobacterales bacterium]